MALEDTAPTASHDKLITWRDIFDEILKSEERIKKAFAETVKPVCDDVKDHEQRLRDIESSGSRGARDLKEVADKLDIRVRDIEDKHRTQEGVSAGRKSIFTAGQKTIAAIAILAGLASLIADKVAGAVFH